MYTIDQIHELTDCFQTLAAIATQNMPRHSRKKVIHPMKEQILLLAGLDRKINPQEYAMTDTVAAGSGSTHTANALAAITNIKGYIMLLKSYNCSCDLKSIIRLTLRQISIYDAAFKTTLFLGSAMGERNEIWLNKTLKELKATITTLNIERRGLSADDPENPGLTQQFNKSKQKLDSIKTNVAALSTSISDAETTILLLTQTLATKTTESTRLGGQNQVLKTDISTKSTDSIKHVDDLIATTRQQAKAESAADEIKRVNLASLGLLSNFSEENKEVLKQISATEGKIRFLQQCCSIVGSTTIPRDDTKAMFLAALCEMELEPVRLEIEDQEEDHSVALTVQ